MRRRLLPLLCAAPFVFGACDKDKPKPDEAKKTEPTPVPSGMVFNDFLPTTGNTAGLGVRDAGLEGGLAAVAAGESEPGAAPGGEAQPPGEKVKVTDPGSEPRAVRKYTFVANKVDKRVITMVQSSTQSVGGQTAPGQEITIKLHLDITPKQVKPAGATVEAKVTKVELPGAPAQAAQMLASLNGLAGTFDVTPQGEVGEMSFAATPAMKNQLAETVVQAVNQGVQILVAPLPPTPIGTGAKWEVGGMPTPEQPDGGQKRFTLKEVTNEGGVVDSELEVKVPRRPVQGPRGTVFLEIDGKGKYSQQVRFNQTSPKVEGELTVNRKIEVSDPKAGKQTVVEAQKVKHTVESAPK